MRAVRRRNIGLVAVVWAVIYGTYLATHAVPAGSSGLYLVVSESLPRNGWQVPFVVDGVAQSPFSFPYPPLAVYLVAGVHELTGVPPMEILRFLPGILFGASLYPWYLFVEELYSEEGALYATVFLATLPAVFVRQLQSDGITTSAAVVGLMVGLAVLPTAFEQRRSAVVAGIAFAVTLLTHPSVAFFFGMTYFVYWSFEDRTLAGFSRGAGVFGLGVLLSAAWWVPAVLSVGVEPFLAPFGIGPLPLTENLKLLAVSGDGRLLFTTTGAWSLPVLGGIYALVRREWWLVAWALVALVRVHNHFFSLVVALLAAVAIAEWLLPSLREETDVSARTIGALAIVVVVGVSLAVGVVGVSGLGPGYAESERRAGQWLDANADENAIVATGAGTSHEWFPYFSDRRAWAYQWGMEWSGQSAVTVESQKRRRLTDCRSATCVDDVFDSYAAPDYLVVASDAVEREGFQASDRYEVVYERRGVTIYRVSTEPTESIRARP